jgi:hypothetical protein
MTFKPFVVVGIGLAATAPLLHGHTAPDCKPTIELCAPSEAMYLPDEQATERAPPMIFAPPVAGYTSTATGVDLARSWLSDSSPPRWRPLPPI